MKKSLFLILSFFFFSCGKSVEKVENATIPTQLLDDLLAAKDVNGLIDRYGAKNLILDTAIIMSDDTLKGSVLFPQSDQEAYIFYHKGKIVDVSIKGTQSKWITKSGLYLGMDLKNVEKINNKNFTISGFNWIHGGTVVSWEGGKLGGNSFSHIARFSNAANKHDGISDDDYMKIAGEAEFDVRHPSIQQLNPVLDQISIVLPYVPEKEEGVQMGKTIEHSQKKD